MLSNLIVVLMMCINQIDTCWTKSDKIERLFRQIKDFKKPVYLTEMECPDNQQKKLSGHDIEPINSNK